MPRFFAEIRQNGEAVITGRDVRHIIGPLRRKVGDELSIRDQDKGYRARITGAEAGMVTLEILSTQELSDRCRHRVHLGMSLIDLKDMDDLLRCVTELGVSEIRLIVSARSNVRDVGGKRMQRWRQIMLEAVKQCERRSIPLLHDPVTLEGFLQRTAPVWPCRLVASLPSNASLGDYRGREAGILIGPEGGFTDAETGAILSSGFFPVHMGKTVLRSYTAALTAIGILAM